MAHKDKNVPQYGDRENLFIATRMLYYAKLARDTIPANVSPLLWIKIINNMITSPDKTMQREQVWMSSKLAEHSTPRWKALEAKTTE